MTSGDYLELSQLFVFCFSIWAVGSVFKFINAQLVGEILVGIALGPYGANWVPYTDALTLIGQLGLTFLVVEGGLSIDSKALKKVGLRAACIAIFGTVIPLLLGWGVLAAFGYPFKEAITAGTTLSSTSIGMATKMLQELGVLDSYLGTLITVAAIFDDVFSLVILAVLSNLTESIGGTGEMVWAIFKPIVVSLAFMILAIILGFAVPKVIDLVMSYMSSNKWLNKYTDPLLYSSLLIMSAGLSVAAGYAGTTTLLGSFAGGYAYSSVPRVKQLWEMYVLPFEILYSLFFATIGFVIPISQMFKKEAVGLGFLYTVPAILGKLVTLFGAKNVKQDGFILGWAMVARGELGFVMATQALNDGLLSETVFAIVVWALLLSTFIAPIVFAFLIKRKLRVESNDSDKENNISNIEDENYDTMGNLNKSDDDSMDDGHAEGDVDLIEETSPTTTETSSSIEMMKIEKELLEQER